MILSSNLPGTRGWRLTGAISFMLVIMAVMAVCSSTTHVEGLRLAIRLTARSSLLLFTVVFIASSLIKLGPAVFSIWLNENRRYLGVAFAASHAIHAACLVYLACLDPNVFAQLTNRGAFIGGGIGYAFIILMTATSFGRPRQFVGPRFVRLIHTCGIWFIWFAFVLNFAKRILRSEYYFFPVALLLFALVIRLLGALSARRIKEA